MHRSSGENDQGFTLIELLVVMIIIGILAAIAIPVFLSQRAKARDTATKADVSSLGKEIATYYVDNTSQVWVDVSSATPPVASIYSGSAVVAANLINSMRMSTGTALGSQSGTTSSTWCVGLVNPSGSQKTYKYSSSTGLVAGTCP